MQAATRWLAIIVKYDIALSAEAAGQSGAVTGAEQRGHERTFGELAAGVVG